VFLQEKEGEPYQDVGSVHAPDAELALCNARDVFVRRPACTGLWLVPAGAIFSMTAEQLEGKGMEHNNPGGTGEPEGEATRISAVEGYSVFCKLKPAGTCILVGAVQAGSPAEAMEAAIASFSNLRRPSVWWVVPKSLIAQSEPGEADSLFEPAFDKTFRLSTDFRTVSAMRAIRNAEKQGDSPL
jgi:ring-1,2-phenylacetyl-CoA epoxidase subunit PaaB